MFSLWRSQHRPEVLLGPHTGGSLDNDHGAIELRFPCPCGQTGVKRLTKEPTPAKAALCTPT
jgi:hypothetical protein